MLPSPLSHEHDAVRDNWNCRPVQLETVWTLTKRAHVAQCLLFSHQFGWELRLEVGGLFQTQVCRSDRVTPGTDKERSRTSPLHYISGARIRWCSMAKSAAWSLTAARISTSYCAGGSGPTSMRSTS